MNRLEKEPLEWNGRKYTKYEALQRQRRLETTMRAQCEEMALLKEGGADEDDLINCRTRYRGTSDEYARFSKAMGLPQQRERVSADGLGNIMQGKTEGGSGKPSPVKVPPVGAKVTAEERRELLSQNSVDISEKSGIIKSGAVSGALDYEGEDYEKAKVHAIRYYDAVRKMTTDVNRIVENTGFSEELVQSIKDFVFNEKHDLGNKYDYFVPDYKMAQSWQRLIEGKHIQKHDLTLLHHEKMERELMKQGFSQSEAHEITSKKYNYAKEAKEYYDQIKRNKKK